MPKEFLNARQVASEYLNDTCSYHKILRLTREGEIPATKLGKSYLYKRSHLDEWASDQFSRPATNESTEKG